jgi:hypothetical protein
MGAATCLFFAMAFSSSIIIRKIDNSYSSMIARQIDCKKISYGIQRHCQQIQARLIDVMLTTDNVDLAREKQLVLNQFREIDKMLADLGKTAVTPETRTLVVGVADSLLVYRRVCSTYFVLLDEKNISQASMLLRFNVQRSFSASIAVLGAIPEQLDLTLKIESDQMTSTNSTMADIIQNAGSLPVLFWVCAAIVLFLIYWGGSGGIIRQPSSRSPDK